MQPFQQLNRNKLFFFLFFSIIECNKLDHNIRNAESYSLFRKHPSSFIIHEANSISSVHKAKEIKLLTKLRVGFSYLKEQKVRHNF